MAFHLLANPLFGSLKRKDVVVRRNRLMAVNLLTAFSIAVIGVTASIPAIAAPLIPAAVHSGVCTQADNNAVTIVIDYQGLGGGTATYCASKLPQGTTGLGALSAAGVSFQGTSHDGNSFICRINGRPAASEAIALPNGEQYKEKCVNTPPATAYWSYWTAKQGGSWGYASAGASSRQVVFGTYEGWSFSLGGGIGNAPAPRVAPVTWNPGSTPKPSTTKPKASTTTTKASTTATKASTSTTKAPTASGQTPAPSKALTTTAKPQTTPPVAPTTSQQQSTITPESTVGSASSSQPTQFEPVETSPVPVPPLEPDSAGWSWQLILAVSLVGGLVVTAVVVAWWRKHKNKT